jgi:hypothetical protein
MGYFRTPLLFTGIALLFGSVCNFYFRRRGRVAMANAALAVMMLVFLNCAHQGLVIFSPVLSSKILSDSLATQFKEGDTVVVNGVYEDASTLNFYGHFQLHVLNARGKGNLYYGSLFPDSPQVFEDDASLGAMWRDAGRVFLWTEDDKIPATVQAAGYKVVARSGGKYILVNR